MKYRTKFLSLLLAVLIFASLATVTTASAAETDAILATSEIFTRQDEDFTTTLYITEGADICDFQITLSYNTELLTLVSATPVNTTGALEVNSSTPGLIHVVFTASSSNVVTKTDLLDLTFHVDDTAGHTTYECLSVNHNYDNEASHLDEETGAFETVDLTTSFASLTLYELGDVNLDTKVSVRDVSLLKRHLTYLTTSPALTEFHLRIADAERDDKVNMRDVARIMRRCAYYTDDVYGDRINVYFYDADGNEYAVKSVLYGSDLTKLPAVPVLANYDEGQWSISSISYVEPELTNITKELKLYAVYGEYQSEAIAYYKQKLTDSYYSGDLPTGLTGDLNLVTTMNYQSGYYAEIVWQSSSNHILNSTTGVFNTPTYPSSLTLTAKITSYDANNAIEAADSIDFVYQVPGMYSIPTMDEIESWLQDFFSDGAGNYVVEYNLKLPLRLDDESFKSSTTSNFEVRLDWQYIDNGSYYPIGEISRGINAKELDLVATVTFNGQPVEGNGQILLENVQVAPIEPREIQNYIVTQIANNVSPLLKDGYELWDEDTVYNTTITWSAGGTDIVSIDGQNVVNVDDSAFNGTLVPLDVVVSYGEEGSQESFTLSYTASVETENTRLERGTDINQYLYDAIKEALQEQTGYTGDLTTDALKAQKFVSLDLSDYASKITSLKGLSYCVNLRALDISGVKLLDSSINQIAGLPKLECLIARGCGLNNLSDGGVAVLSNSIYLKLLDLSDNNFTNLDSVLEATTTYGELKEVYLSNNKLEDISALSRAPGMSMLSLGGNGLTTEDIQQLTNFPYLNYLSLANNEIDDVTILSGLVNLTELRLQHNQISDVSALRSLKHLRALYLGHNSIKSGVEFLKTLTKLEVLYLNDNNISSISALSTLTKLRSLNVTNNPKLNDLSVLSNCKSTIEEIYAENDSLTSFNFIEGMSNLRILMLSGNAPEDATESDLLTGQLSGLTKMQVLTLSDKPLQDLNFLAYMPDLNRLDVANCGLSAFSGDTSNIASIAARYANLRTLDISNNDMTGYESEITNLRNLTNLVILYADNICDGLDISKLVNEMPQLRYVSMENCGITDLSWMAKKYYLTFVDLANNNITKVDLASQLSGDSLATLQYLYLDTAADASFATFYEAGIDNVLKELSLKGIALDSITYLPDMTQLTYLNLSGTGLTSLQGEDPDFYDVYSIERYKNLRTLDVTGLEVELAPVLNLANLNTIYAVGVPESMMFYKSNLHTLQSLYNKGVTGYLYDNQTVYTPVAQTEGTEILNLIEDFSCAITVAADNMISDNNPVLPAVINDYEIDWTISNETNYEIVDNKLAVKTYENIDDETLTLTAAITPYDDQEAVTRQFTIDVSILRASADTRSTYCTIDSSNFGNEMSRNDTFAYNLQLKAAVTEGFSQPVKPVGTVAYDYSCVLESGSATPYVNVLEDLGSHNYMVKESADLNTTVTITVEIYHEINGEKIVDDSISDTFTVKERTYTVTYVANGGTVLNDNGLAIESEKVGEESVLFPGVTITRTGYIFDGWFTDAEFTTLYWVDGMEEIKMPANDLTLYAKWTAHCFNVHFDANGGTVDEASRLVLCDIAFGELPVPTRPGYTFEGWFTADDTQITAETSMATAEDVTVYAKWTLNTYTATWNTGTGYTIAVNRTASPNGNAELGALSSGAEIYYGDTLEVTYTVSTGYTMGETGATAINVTGDVTKADIYASATVNKYTYNIVYKSVNGTALGSATATFDYGTTNVITPFPFDGYESPATQSVTWDSTTAKTITFTYGITPVATTQTVKSGTWWTNDGAAALTYVAKIQYQNRTANSVQVRVVWTNTIVKYSYYGYTQYFTATTGGQSTGKLTICSASAFGSSSDTNSVRTATKNSGWLTVPLSTTNRTTVSISATWSDALRSGSWSGTYTIPAY